MDSWVCKYGVRQLSQVAEALDESFVLQSASQAMLTKTKIIDEEFQMSTYPVSLNLWRD